ncbi:MAG: GHKL domain-containing protein [Ruthenibacterium sp.]
MVSILLFLAIFFGSMGARLYFGNAVYGKFYLLFVQAPLFIFFWLTSRYRGIKLFFVLLTAIVFTAPCIIFSLLLKQFFHPTLLMIFIANLISFATIIFVVYRFLKKPFNYMLEHGENRLFWMFSAIPLLYYLYSYGKTKYQFATMPIGNPPLLALIPDVIALTAYVLLLYVFQAAHEKDHLQLEQAMMSMRLDASQRQLENFESSYEQARIYRHDMRHHFALIDSYLSEGEIAEARAYIGNAQSDIDAVTPMHYCLNHTVNLILSSYATKAAKVGIVLQVEADLPQNLPLPETELCSILSNGLENAVTAAAKTCGAKRIVSVRCVLHKGHLLLHIENPYEGTVDMHNNIPQSHTTGHGFGVQSIALLAKKYDGCCSFTPQNGTFVLQAVLPLKKTSVR